MNVAKKLLGSRKFAVMLLGMLGAIGARLGLPEEAADQVAMTIVVLAGTYVGAQGMADLGKEREAVKAEAKEDD
jgi:hypothetical protein